MMALRTCSSPSHSEPGVKLHGSDFLVHFNKRYKTRGLSPGFSFQMSEIWSQSSSLSFNNTVFSVKQLMLFRSYAESMVEFFTA